MSEENNEIILEEPETSNKSAVVIEKSVSQKEALIFGLIAWFFAMLIGGFFIFGTIQARNLETNATQNSLQEISAQDRNQIIQMS